MMQTADSPKSWHIYTKWHAYHPRRPKYSQFFLFLFKFLIFTSSLHYLDNNILWNLADPKTPFTPILTRFHFHFFYGACSPVVDYGLLILEVFRHHTRRHTTVGRTPLDEWSARRRDLYLTTHTLTTDKHPRPRRDSNPQSQHASGRRPTP